MKGERPARHGLPWSEADDRLLTWLWGQVSAGELARRLERTPNAVLTRAYGALALGSVARGTWSMTALAETAGYDQETIKRVCRELGITLSRCQPIHRELKRRRKPHVYALDEEQGERVIEWLRLHGSERTFDRRNREWGQGGRPPACVRCHRTERPHAWRGLCKPCAVYMHQTGRSHLYPTLRERARLAEQTEAA